MCASNTQTEHTALKKLKYLPKISTALSFLAMLILFIFLFLGRKMDMVRPQWIVDHFPGFYGHVSNLCISYIIYTASGYFWLMMGIRFKSIVVMGIAIILVNFIYELFIPVLNDCDIVDAYFGTVGTIAGFVYLLLVHKFGLKANPLLESQAKV